LNKNQMTILPVTEILEDLKAALTEHRGAVLQAPPGAGKTTLVPLALLEQPWLANQKILLLEPRRLATRAAASRMAALRGEPVGRTVGYRMRMDRCVGPATRIEVVTEGILTRLLQSDPALQGVGLVIFDEFHERSLQADLGLTLCLDIQGTLNLGLRLLVMSATLETERLAIFLGDVPVVACQGRQYPVETRYGAPRQREGFATRVVDTVRQAAVEHDASILAFLPGAAEIGRVARRLKGAGLGNEWIVAPLYGRLTRAEQDQAIITAPRGKRKIVLASAIAETSLTIEGIRVVVDSGYMRVPRYDIRSGMTRLMTLPVTRAAADQRRGRAGRTAPGICYRLWSEMENAALVRANRPEIEISDMAALVLELTLWGVHRPDDLKWLDAPPQAACREACDLLQILDAIDSRGQITAAGRRMAGLPVHPRLAHMLVRAKEHHLGGMACDLAALLNERDFLRWDHDTRDADLQLRLDCLAFMRGDRRRPPAGLDMDQGAARRIVKTARILHRRLDPPPDRRRRGSLGRLLAWAYPDRIAQRRSSGAGRFLLASGHGAYLNPSEPLAGQDYIVAAALDGDRSDARIFLAVACDRDVLRKQFAGRLAWQAEVDWDPHHQRVDAVRRRCLGALVFETERQPDPDPAKVCTAMLKGVRHHGLDCLPWTRQRRAFQDRVNFVRRVLGGDWPDLSDTTLADNLEAWLAPHILGLKRLRDLKKVKLGRALTSLLDWRQQKALERLAPPHVAVPSGRKVAVDYGSDPPVLAVRLQEMFGQTQAPAVADGKVPLVVHLLSPAGRPVQITRDLAGFWRNGYNAVRKDLRGRYPKHYWPEDPLTARATQRLRP
jgi:ATP-dependent helicase HrpB